MKLLKIINWICLILVATFINISCESNAPDVQLERTDIELSESSNRAAKELGSFYTRLTEQAVEMTLNDIEKSDKNTIVSPLSASMLLGMIANGMADETETLKIAEYLGVSDLNALNELSATLLSSIPNVDKKSRFLLKNSIWVNNYLRLSEEFVTLIRHDYMGELSYQDFSDEKKLLSTINKWCSRNTNNSIVAPIKNIHSSDLVVLINALFFKSEWRNEHEFLLENTKPDVFYGYNETTTPDFMISDYGRRLYQYSPNFSSTSLYFGNGAFCLSLVLPDERMSKDNAIPSFNEEERNALAANSQDAIVRIKIPKFSIKGNVDLKTLMEKADLLGDNTSNMWSMFSPAQKGSLTMQQNTAFSIDEKGVSAAVVSDGAIMDTAGPIDPNKTHTMVFDRPFYFFLYETSTGACIISGLIADLPN